MRKKSPEITDTLRKEVITKYEQLGSGRKVSISMALSQRVVERILKEGSVKRRLHKTPSSIVNDIQRLMSESDMPKKEMIETLGIGGTTFKRICRKLGLKRQTTRRPPPARQSGPMLDTMIGKYGKEEGELRHRNYVSKMSQNTSGSNNPMYGKPSPQGAGNGWKGWYKGHYFRSLREAMFMIECDTDGLSWTSGERISIDYLLDEKERTYRPDFVIGNDIVEIKPTRLQKSPSVLAKADAARLYCLAHGMSYKLIEVQIKPDLILRSLDSGDIKFTRDYEARFRAYVSKA